MLHMESTAGSQCSSAEFNFCDIKRRLAKKACYVGMECSAPSNCLLCSSARPGVWSFPHVTPSNVVVHAAATSPLLWHASDVSTPIAPSSSPNPLFYDGAGARTTDSAMCSGTSAATTPPVHPCQCSPMLLSTGALARAPMEASSQALHRDGVVHDEIMNPKANAAQRQH